MMGAALDNAVETASIRQFLRIGYATTEIWYLFRRQHRFEPIGLSGCLELAASLEIFRDTESELSWNGLRNAIDLSRDWPTFDTLRPHDVLRFTVDLESSEGKPRRICLTPGTVDSQGRMGSTLDVPTRRGVIRAELALAPKARSAERVGAVTSAVTSAASWIAGPAYGWTAEAWKADLAHGPYGRDTPMSRPRKLAYALGLLAYTAPRYRLLQVSGRLGHLARAALTRILFSDAATGLTVGAALAATSSAIWSESGITGTATFLSTGVPAAAWGIRWLRRKAATEARGDRQNGSDA